MSYCVYAHISPSNKYYIGITGQIPEKRWGKNGKNYLTKKKAGWTHPAFAPAILKYSWDAFEHKILFTDLTLEEANLIEEDLVYFYYKEKMSYNTCKGGGLKKKLRCKTQQEIHRDYYIRHKEQENARSKKYREEHIEELRVKWMEYEKRRDPERRRAWYEATREIRSQKAKERYLAKKVNRCK